MFVCRVPAMQSSGGGERAQGCETQHMGDLMRIYLEGASPRNTGLVEGKHEAAEEGASQGWREGGVKKNSNHKKYPPKNRRIKVTKRGPRLLREDGG